MLVSLDDMKTYLGIPLGDTSQDVYLTSELILFSETVEKYCGRTLELRTFQETIYHQDFSRVENHLLYQYPVVSITSATEKETGCPDVVLNTRVNKRTGLFNIVNDSEYKTSLFTNYGKAAFIEVEYQAGYASVPMEVQEAIKQLIEARYNKKNSGIALNFGNNVQRISVPGVMGIDFDYTLSSNDRKTKYGMILGDYQNIFDNYASERTLNGDTHITYLEVL